MHHLRLGAKGGKINVLYDKARKRETSCARRAAAVVATCAWLAAASPSLAESPLERCWREASTRVELQPCLRQQLEEAENRLGVAYADVLREAKELDRVSGDGSSNLARTIESDSRWREYRRSECMRRAQAMSPGTGSGDVLLACRIDLTDERVKHLEMP